MLNVMRDNLRHLKPVLWIVAISMVAYLGAYFSCGDSVGVDGAPWAARVGGAEISQQAFLQAAQNQDQFYRQTFGSQYDQFRAQFRIGPQSIQYLIDRQIILIEAEKLGLSASKAEIEKRVLEDPSFKEPDGSFIGTARYVDLVNRNWQGEGGVAGFERLLAESITIDKWRYTVASSARVSDEELLASYRSRSDRTGIDYAVVASADQDVSTEVDSATAQAWYASHPEDYRRPEGLLARYVIVSRQDRLAEIQLTDEELRSYYEGHPADFERPEQRRASHILIRVPNDAAPEDDATGRARAEDVLTRVQAGEGFEEIARGVSEDELSGQRGGDLDFFPRGAMVPEFETAVFQTSVGSFAPLTRTSFGYHVIKVTGERPAGPTPFDEARDDLRERLRRERADAAAEALAREVRSGAASAADLERAASASGIQVEESVVRRGGTITGIDAPRAFVDGLFDLEIGALEEPTSVRQGWVVAGVVESVPASIAPFDEVEAAVKVAVIGDRSIRAAEGEARKAFERHGSVEKAAKALGIEVQDSGSINPTQSVPRTGGMSPELKEMLFGPEAVQGASGVARVPAGAVMFEITSRELFDPEEFESSRASLSAEILDQRRAEIVEAALVQLRLTYKIEINDSMVNAVDA